MNRAPVLASLLLAAAGCATTAERLPLKPLPEDAEVVPYGDLHTRARLQATSATEAFYVNEWDDLAVAARGLAQTASYLPKAANVPPGQKDRLGGLAEEIAREAETLQEAAKARDVTRVNEALQRLNLKIRELRAEG